MKLQHPREKERLTGFQESLLRWFRRHHRFLPWRSNPTPYRVWISEIMLQQTQVKTVLPYYKNFIRRFPNIEILAKASEQHVLELWSGLGYYNRARNLHKAARQIVKNHGSFPQEFETILALPGVGRYTAGAICSIAFNQPYPVVDGNIRRVLARMNGWMKNPPQSRFWAWMSKLLPEQNASSFNQAMMELGALICTPTHPRCPHCPVKNYCTARKSGMQDCIPDVRKKRTAISLQIAALVIKKGRQILLSSRNPLPFVPGEWGLPSQLLHGRQSAEDVASELCREAIGQILPLTPCVQIRHSISRFRITAYAFCGKPDFSKARLTETSKYIWSPRSQYKIRLISSLFRKILQKIEELQ